MLLRDNLPTFHFRLSFLLSLRTIYSSNLGKLYILKSVVAECVAATLAARVPFRKYT
jgi:hypothetical protein